jgi:hypothetical protein
MQIFFIKFLASASGNRAIYSTSLFMLGVQGEKGGMGYKPIGLTEDRALLFIEGVNFLTKSSLFVIWARKE